MDTEPYRPNQILSHDEREALNGLRRRANRSIGLAHQVWPLAVVLVVLGIQIAHDKGSALLLTPIAVVVLYAWNAYRLRVDEIALAINGLFKIAEETERRGNSPL